MRQNGMRWAVALAVLLIPGGEPATLAQAVATKAAADEVAFPEDLVNWAPLANNPVFTAEGEGHWDDKIRERGWILHEGDEYRMWYTGYDGKKDDIKLPGYATSKDGIHWQRSPKNPLLHDHWVEDMTVVREGGTYYMFAEGEHDNHAEMLTSPDGIDWRWEGELDVRAADGNTQGPRPCGTPTVWVEDGTWYLFYEVGDKGVWLAKTREPMSRMWVNVQDEPVLKLGPGEYDKEMLAMDQVIKRGGTYYAIYHGSGDGDGPMPRKWNTDIARSSNLVHWEKYARNPIVSDNKSSGELVPVGGRYRLYTMHDRVDVFVGKESGPASQRPATEDAVR